TGARSVPYPSPVFGPALRLLRETLQAPPRRPATTILQQQGSLQVGPVGRRQSAGARMKPELGIQPVDSTHPAKPVFAWRNAVLAAPLPPMRKLVALVVSVHMNGHLGNCFPGIRLLMAQTGLRRTTVYEHL